LLIRRIEVNEKIAEFVEKVSEGWGVHVEQIILKDMRLSSLLSNNLSTVSKTRRDVESQIISAKADLECAQLYRVASDILDMKAAVQIRFLETLENMNSMPSKKITIIPLRQSFEQFQA
jgi:erythrocyte band 7 integral membrane protein